MKKKHITDTGPPAPTNTFITLLSADPQVEKWLDEAEKNKAALAAGDGRNLQLMRRQWVHDASLTSEMAGELSRLTCEGENLHTEFRKNGDWSKIKDWDAHAGPLLGSGGEHK